jgi:hypoxanthine-DNA glycosylase
MRIHGFPPLVSPSTRVLILGSMPSDASLRAEEYYAHPRNQFWPLMQKLFAIERTAPYEERLAKLRSAGVGLWDVLASCIRPSSLDSDIEASSIVPNDFARFFAAHPSVRVVCFNGAKARDTYRRRVLPNCSTPEVEFHALPSTSPAHASLSFEGKLSAWRIVARCAGTRANARPAR